MGVVGKGKKKAGRKVGRLYIQYMENKLFLDFFLGGIEGGTFAGDLFKPLDHAEHDNHGEEADGHEDDPALPDRNLVVEGGADPEESVAHGGSTEPEALAEAEEVLGGNLGDEAQAQRADEELGNSHAKIVDDEYPRGSFLSGCGGSVEGAELGARGVTLDVAEDGKEEVGAARYTHADGNFAGSGNAFAATGETFKEPHDGEGEQDDEEGVDGLPDLGRDG